jgi:hypothetical protein
VQLSADGSAVGALHCAWPSLQALAFEDRIFDVFARGSAGVRGGGDSRNALDRNVLGPEHRRDRVHRDTYSVRSCRSETTGYSVRVASRLVRSDVTVCGRSTWGKLERLARADWNRMKCRSDRIECRPDRMECRANSSIETCRLSFSCSRPLFSNVFADGGYRLHATRN